MLATALGVAFGSAHLFGVSFALGAFFAGVVLNESDFSHRAAADSLPLQDAFAVLFFVSVGMLFDPGILLREPLAVLAVLAVIVIGKSLAAFGIVLALGHPVSTALTVSASLAQIGEFSFILAGLGVALDLLPPQGRDLILAGALLSITLNPLVFWGIGRLIAVAGSRQPLKQQPNGSDVASVAPIEQRGHVILIGYGRVGRVVLQGLRAQQVPVVVVDQDLRRVDALRKQGVAAVHGNAVAPAVLPTAHAGDARLIVVATPAGYETERVIQLARAINPRIDIAVRCHSDAELVSAQRLGAGLAITGERELAFGLTDYALRCVGLPEEAARAAVANLRRWGDDPSQEEPERRTPELRQHRD